MKIPKKNPMKPIERRRQKQSKERKKRIAKHRGRLDSR